MKMNVPRSVEDGSEGVEDLAVQHPPPTTQHGGVKVAATSAQSRWHLGRNL